ncbi:unnamed protein product [Gadus morhua 'NCC']
MLFTGVKKSAKDGFEIKKISTQQVKRKWENLTARYKDLRKPPSGVGTEDGKATAASWKWYSEMDGILGQKPSISPPVVISSSGQGAAVATPSSVPCTSADDTITPPPNKRHSSGAATGLRELMELMERRERQDLEREREAREQEERRWRQLEEREERRDRERLVPVRCCHTRPSSNGSSQDRTCIIPSPCLNDPLACRTIIVTPMVILHNVWLNKVLGMSNYPPEKAHNSMHVRCTMSKTVDRGMSKALDTTG